MNDHFINKVRTTKPEEREEFYQHCLKRDNLSPQELKGWKENVDE
ncbi:MAG: hypothetical protein NY202_01965 [Mollicutes bacterium UO1]